MAVSVGVTGDNLSSDGQTGHAAMAAEQKGGLISSAQSVLVGPPYVMTHDHSYCQMGAGRPIKGSYGLLYDAINSGNTAILSSY